MKQIIQIEHIRVKNPTWQEKNQLPFYRCDQGFELLRTNPAIGQGWTWTQGLWITPSALLTIQPHYFLPVLGYEESPRDLSQSETGNYFE